MIPIIGYLCLQGLLIADVVTKKTGYGKAGVVSLLASLTIWFLFNFSEWVRRENGLGIESHWGGLGGGVGGFRISRALIYLAGALCFGMLSILAYYPNQFLKTPPASAEESSGKESGKDKHPPADTKGAATPAGESDKTGSAKPDSTAPKP